LVLLFFIIYPGFYQEYDKVRAKVTIEPNSPPEEPYNYQYIARTAALLRLFRLTAVVGYSAKGTPNLHEQRTSNNGML
jgi:hypothetical protein